MKSKETQLQKSCLAWFRFQYPNIARLLISATPENNPGVSDLILLYSNGFYPYLCFRFDKDERDAILGTKEWQHSIESVGGRYLVVSNFDGFREAVNDYFKEGIKF